MLNLGRSAEATATDTWAEGLAPDPKRKSVLIQNRDGSDAILVNMDAAPSADDDALSIAAGASLRIYAYNSVWIKRGAASDIDVAFLEELEVDPS